MMQYRVAAKVTMAPEDVEPWIEVDVTLQPGVVGYKLMAGLCVAYVSPEVYAQGVAEGVIQPADEPLPQLPCRLVRADGGLEALEELDHAIRSCSLPRLKRRLERLNDGAKALTVELWSQDWNSEDKNAPRVLLEEIRVDLEKMEVLDYTSHAPDGWTLPPQVFRGTHDYADFLARLARLQSVEYMNDGDLCELFRESDFYSLDRFDQKFYRLRFRFTPEEAAPNAPTMPPPEAVRDPEEDRALFRRFKEMLDALEPAGDEPFPELPAYIEEAKALRRDREAYLSAYESVHLWDISDQASLDYAALARRYVDAVSRGNFLVMEDVIRDHRLFSQMGDHILLLGASLLWLLGAGRSGRNPELWDQAKVLAGEAMLGCYLIRSSAPLSTRFPLFRHWKYIDLPDRETLEDEWLALWGEAEDMARGFCDLPTPQAANPGVRSSDFGAWFAREHSYKTVLTDGGDSTVAVLKVLRDATGLSPAQVKALVASLPAAVYEGEDKDEAYRLKEALEAVGASAEVQEDPA